MHFYDPRCGTSWSKYRSGLFIGIVERINKRMKELYKEREVINPSLTALTINLTQESTIYMNQLFPNLRYSHVKSYDSNGINAGRRAGDKVSIVSPSHHVGGGSLRLIGGR
jgi:hypothetical protein